MTFNIISVLFYLIAFAVGRWGDIEKHGVGWLSACYAEITGHAFICTLWLGFEPCFYLYAIIVLMVAAYVLYLACEKRQFLGIIMIFTVITLVSVLFCLIYFNFFDPIITSVFGKIPDKSHIGAMRAVNLLFNIIITFFFSVMFIVEIQVLIRKLNTVNEKLNYSAMHDALTGLYNRRSLYKMYDEIKDNGNFCVVMGDIDNFKKINDTYGHFVGNEVLNYFSTVFREQIHSAFPKHGYVYRFGGEEFTIVVSNHSLEEVYQLLQSIEKFFNNKSIVTKEGMKLTISFSCSLTDRLNDELLDTTLKRADKMLYGVKNNGRGWIVTDQHHQRPRKTSSERKINNNY